MNANQYSRGRDAFFHNKITGAPAKYRWFTPLHIARRQISLSVFLLLFFFLVWQVLHHEHARKSENSRKQQNTNLINREDVKLILKSLNQHISEALFFLERMMEETSCTFLICVVSWSSGGPVIQEANLWQEGYWFKSPDRIALTGMILECLLHPPNPSVRFPWARPLTSVIQWSTNEQIRL